MADSGKGERHFLTLIGRLERYLAGERCFNTAQEITRRSSYKPCFDVLAN